ncbi:MAG: hypothetical protein U1F27_05825 [Turneriella sp.]
MKPILCFLLFAQAAHATQVIDVLGGSGLAWSSWSDTSTIAGDIYKASTVGSVPMRETYFAGLRYSGYSGKDAGGLVAGVEFSTTQTFPFREGEWQYRHNDSNGNAKYASTQPATWQSVPSMKVVRFSGHIGFQVPVDNYLAAELGVLGGLGIANGEYRAQYPDNANYAEGFGGIGLHIALRAALQFFPQSRLALGVEYRLMAEGFVSASGIFPWLYTNSSSMNLTGHMFLLTLGYRFGN